MIVVDASVLANALTDDGPLGEVARVELAREEHWAGPEHLVVEVFSAVRGRVLAGKVTGSRGRDALDGLASVTVDVVSPAPLLSRMWQLRDNLSGYDAAYASAAESCGCALVTADRRLSNAPGLQCEIRLALPGG